MTKRKEKLLVLLGPTASGKTALSIELAKALETEIISGDSMLVYRGFDIGSAKPTKAEMAGVRHHMIDILPGDAAFNLMDFLQRVKALIAELNQAGKIPMLVGGTGLYIQSLLEGYELNQQSEDPEYRQYLEQLAEEKGRAYVHDMLRQVNPEAADRLHINNFRRIVRALEVYHLGGEQISQAKSGGLVYDCYVAGLTWQRQKLYDRINRRVDIMLQQGLEQEIRGLLAAGLGPDNQAMKGIGYKEMLPAMRGELSLQAAAELIQKNSRHFAKRQLTWYRRMNYIHWFQPELYSEPEALQANVLWHVQQWLAK